MDDLEWPRTTHFSLSFLSFFLLSFSTFRFRSNSIFFLLSTRILILSPRLINEIKKQSEKLCACKMTWDGLSRWNESTTLRDSSCRKEKFGKGKLPYICRLFTVYSPSIRRRFTIHLPSIEDIFSSHQINSFYFLNKYQQRNRLNHTNVSTKSYFVSSWMVGRKKAKKIYRIPRCLRRDEKRKKYSFRDLDQTERITDVRAYLFGRIDTFSSRFFFGKDSTKKPFMLGRFFPPEREARRGKSRQSCLLATVLSYISYLRTYL